MEGKSNLDEKCSQGGTSKDKGSTSDAGMEIWMEIMVV